MLEVTFPVNEPKFSTALNDPWFENSFTSINRVFHDKEI